MYKRQAVHRAHASTAGVAAYLPAVSGFLIQKELEIMGGDVYKRQAQKTEDLVGPYELHDFFLYYAIRWAFPPRKVLRLAEHAFGRTYPRAVVLQWLRT